MTLNGLDISKYQGKPDFDQVKTSGQDFIILKASEGVGYQDPEFTRNQIEARRVGLLLGYYHFARTDLGNTPEAEANWFLKTIGQLQDGEILVLDWECANQKQADVDWCKKWLDYTKGKTGVAPLIYLNQSQHRFNWQSVVDAGYGLWIAAYTQDPNNNNFNKGLWPFAAMQQWTSSHKVPGIFGNVDANVFFGDINTFKAYGFKSLDKPSSQVIWTDQTKIPLNLVTVLETYGEVELQQLKSLFISKDRDLVDTKKELEYKTQQKSIPVMVETPPKSPPGGRSFIKYLRQLWPNIFK